MHEMSIAAAVLDCVERHAAGRRVTHVQLKVGHLRQVVPPALHFSWSLITDNTVAEGAALGIETVAAAGTCRRCGEHSAQHAFPLHCDACGAFEIDIVAGEELDIDWIEVADCTAAPVGRSA